MLFVYHYFKLMFIYTQVSLCAGQILVGKGTFKSII